MIRQKFQIFPVRFPGAMPQNGINNFKGKKACYMGMGCVKQVWSDFLDPALVN